MSVDINSKLIGSIISFRTYASSVLSDEYTNVKVIGFGSYQIATGYISPAELHAIVYPSLPEGTPNDYKAYEYMIIQIPGGKTTAIGIPWIIADSVTIDGTIEIDVKIYDKSIDDILRLRQILASNGFMNVSISTKSVNVDS